MYLSVCFHNSFFKVREDSESSILRVTQTLISTMRNKMCMLDVSNLKETCERTMNLRVTQTLISTTCVLTSVKSVVRHGKKKTKKKKQVKKRKTVVIRKSVVIPLSLSLSRTTWSKVSKCN